MSRRGGAGGLLKRKRMTPSQRLDFERACNTIAAAILIAAFIVSTRGGAS